MNKIFQFGENVEGYRVPVLNEREVRASAGILFLFAYTSLLIIFLSENFAPMKFFILVFLFDFLIRVFINPRFAPTLIIGRFIVRKQRPEYVGAPQKKFAWIIGIVLALTMFVLMVVMNTISIITGLICFICLIFLFFESVFGICLGCKFYNIFYKEEASYCPGYTCEVGEKHEINRISGMQWIMVLVLAGFLTASILLLKNSFKSTPEELFKKYGGNTELVEH